MTHHTQIVILIYNLFYLTPDLSISCTAIGESIDMLKSLIKENKWNTEENMEYLSFTRGKEVVVWFKKLIEEGEKK